MSNSRMRLSSRIDDEDKPHNSSKGKGVILETPYKPGFVDDKDLETVKMAVDKELSDISNAFYQTTERTADTITRVDKLEISGETQYGELTAKIETVDKVSKEGDVALAERITTFEASTNNEFGKVNAAITETNRVMAEQDGLLAEKIDSIVGSFEGELGPLFAQIDEVRQLSITGDAAIGTRIDNMEVTFNQADKDLAASIKTESESRVDADTALSKRIDTLSATVTTEDKKLSAAITTEQTARVDADKALASSISKVEADYKAADVKTNAAITNESTARSDADKALATNISKVEADYKAADNKVAADSKALIQTESTARADGDSALAGQILTVKAELDGDIASVRQFATTEVGGAVAAVDKETADRLAAQAVLDGKISKETADRLIAEGILDGKIATADGRLDEESAQRLADQAVLDGKITQEVADRLVAEGLLNGSIAGVADRITKEEAERLAQAAVLAGKISQEEADRLIAQGILDGKIDATNAEVGKINAKWGVELDVNGKISGIVMNNNGARSNFEVRADLFRFTDTSGNASGGFVSSGGVTQFHGAVYAQAGIFDHVVINESCTYKGSITSNQIQDTAVTAILRGSNAVNIYYGITDPSSINADLVSFNVTTPRPYDRVVSFDFPSSIFYTYSVNDRNKTLQIFTDMYYNGGLITRIEHINVNNAGPLNGVSVAYPASIGGNIPANTSGNIIVRTYLYLQDKNSIRVEARPLPCMISIFKSSSELS